MFDKATTYHKTARGADAIAHRSAELTPKHRSMLILVDGKRGFAELEKLGGMLGDAEQLMARLEELGFIEPVAGAAPAPAARAPSSAPAPLAPAASAHPTVPLADAKRFAVRRLNDLLGPSADDLCIRLEAAKTAQEFLAVLHKAEGVVRQFSGAQAAEKFAADMQSHRPG